MKPSDTPAWRKQWKIENYQGKRRILSPEKAQAHVQELVTQHGLTLRGIAEAAGVSPFIVSDLNRGLKKLIHRDTEKAILAVTPEDVLGRPNAVGLVPKAWDDETIDDPQAEPNLGLTQPKRGRPAMGPVPATDAQLEDVEFLVGQAYKWDAITERLGVEPDSLERLLYRKGRNDLINRAKNMDHRRDYARAS